MDVPAADDPRIQVHIPVPVKGRKTPMVLRVPRFDFIDEPTYDECIAAIEAIEKEHADLVPRKRQRLIHLVWLKAFVPPKDYEVCETLALGQLDAIMLEWSNRSSIPLGELLASGTSSTANTEAPSSMTSTSGAGRGATSDAA